MAIKGPKDRSSNGLEPVYDRGKGTVMERLKPRRNRHEFLTVPIRSDPFRSRFFEPFSKNRPYLLADWGHFPFKGRGGREQFSR